MERQRGTNILAIIALVVAVAGLTVAFAAMSQKLTISGTTTMDTATWDVHFEDLVIKEPEGAAKLLTEPTLGEKGTSFGNFEVVLTRPGDAVEFNFNVKNAGDIDAKFTDWLVNGMVGGNLSSYSYFSQITPQMLETIYPKADWDGNGETTAEERQKCIEVGLVPGMVFDMQQNDILKPTESKSVTLRLMFSRSATELPKGELVINVDMEFIFEQA